MKINWKKLTELIAGNKKILLSTHINPDADGLGSQVAIYHHLKKINKDCRIINISNMMDKYEFLNNNKKLILNLNHHHLDLHVLITKMNYHLL